MTARATDAAPMAAAAVLGLLVMVGAVAATRAAPELAPLGSVDWRGDFTVAEHATAERLQRRVLPLLYAGTLVGLATSLLLGFTPLGGRLVASAARGPAGLGGWPGQVMVGVAVVLILGRGATLPFAVFRERAFRDTGLSTRTWLGWAGDLARSFLVQAVILAAVVLLVVGLARSVPRRWWIVGAAVSAALVVVMSFGYPLIVEPLFNRFTSMPASPLREELLHLAERDGLPVRDVLVADASRRTSTLNAYVSGLGASRRLVVYDNLLARLPDAQVRSVVAHELGHVKAADVAIGTGLGALAAAAAICVIAGFGPWLSRRAGAETLGDPRATAALLAAFALLATLSTPAQSLISRRIEARADVHALELTADPASVAQLYRALALGARADLDPDRITVWLFGSHPTAPQRIAAARRWAAENSLPVPAPLAGG